jgi:hypothetical protein
MVYDFAMDDGVSAAVKRPKLHYPRNERHEGIVAIDFAVDALYVNATRYAWRYSAQTTIVRVIEP